VFVTAYKKGCFPVNDSSDVTFEALPVVSATATPTCFADHRVILAGVSTKSGLKNSATWTSDGSGIFAPHPDSISNVYTPSATDISGKTNKLTITSKGQKYCPASDTTIVWNYVPFPLADVGKDDTVCVNTTISRTTVSDPDWKYEWKSSALAGIVSSNSTISSLISKDTTTLFVTVKNSRNCEAKDSVMILGITPPTLSLSPKICFYAPVSITASVAKPPALGKYTWKLADSVLIETSATLMLNQTGKYTYDYVFKTCSASAKMEAFAPPKLLVKDTSSCKNVLAQIEANPIAGALYFWNNSAVGVPGNTFNINAGNGISGAKVLVIDANTCRDSSTFNVKIYPYPDFTLKGVDICPNEKGELQAALLDSSLLATHIPTATWFRNGIKIPSASGQKLTYNVPGIYKLEIAVRGCISIHSETIENKPSPKINIPLRYKLCFETDPDLVLKSNPFAKYKWLSEEGDLIDTTQTIAVKPDKDTHYQLFVTNEFSCKDSVKMLVRKVCPPRLFVPNVITPESADVNSALRIFGAHYTNFEITIFSRWGEVIFNTKDDKNAWDGMYINENMPIGNYQWQVTYEGDSEEYKGPYKKTGDVAVVR
jgi:gliding motility-associated-like protein